MAATPQVKEAHVNSAIDVMTPEETKFFETRGEVPPDAQSELPPEEKPEIAAEGQKVEIKEVDLSEPEDNDENVAEAGKNATKVSIGALHKERKLRKAAEAAAAEQKIENARISERVALVQGLIQQSQKVNAPVTDQIPDMDTDPVGHFKAKFERLEAWKTQQESQATTVSNLQQLGTLATQREQEFIKDNPDYTPASIYLQNARASQLKVMGYDDMTIKQTMANEAMTLAANAINRGENPAKWVYEMAKSLGYKAPTENVSRETNGVPAPTADEIKVAMAAKGQSKGGGLGEMAGTAPIPTTLDTLLKMSDDDFFEATKGNKFEKLLASAKH